MHSEITFIDGKTVNFDETADVKMTLHGVEVLQREADDQVRILFPWARIDRVTAARCQRRRDLHLTEARRLSTRADRQRALYGPRR